MGQKLTGLSHAGHRVEGELEEGSKISKHLISGLVKVDFGEILLTWGVFFGTILGRSLNIYIRNEYIGF